MNVNNSISNQFDSHRHHFEHSLTMLPHKKDIIMQPSFMSDAAWCLFLSANWTTYDLGNCSGGAPFRWNMPSMKTPFFPLHFMKKFGWSKFISRWTLEMKLECPMLTSTSPLLLFLPIVMRVLCISNLKSRPSKRAMEIPPGSGAHWIFDGLAGADLSESKAQTSFSEGCCTDITRSLYHQNGSSKGKHSPRASLFTSRFSPQCTASSL